MKKKYLLIIIAVVVILILVYFFIRTNTICLDKGSSSIYFEKNYYLTHLSEFNNKSGWAIEIPKEAITAKYSESADCFDKGSYFIRENERLIKVSRERYNNFLEEYDSSSLLVQVLAFGPRRGIIDVSSNRAVCNTNSHSDNPECINITD